MTNAITPRYKLMLFYDLASEGSDDYYQFIMNEMIPIVHERGLYLFRVFHTLWGDSPLRQAEFVAEDLATIQNVLESDAWHKLEAKLLQHATNYRRKIVRFRPGFQL